MAPAKHHKAPLEPEQDGAARAPSFLYAKIAWGGLAIAVAVAAVVLASVSGSATVSVKLKTESTSERITLRVLSKASADTTAPNVVGDIVDSVGSAKATKTIVAGASLPGRAHGEVTLINTSAHSQPLVATTRIVSANGVLFRLSRAVTVPAHGKATAEIMADEVGEAGDVDPGRFTIPGLSSSLQRVIYGQSTEAMRGGLTQVRRVDAVDISEVAARAEIEAVKNAEAALTAAPTLARFSRPTTTIRTLNAKAGQNVAELTADVHATVTHVLVDPVAANVALRSIIRNAAAERGRDVVAMTGDVSSFALGKIYRTEGYAELEGTVTTITRPLPTGLETELQRLFAGMSKEDAIAQRRSRDDIDDIEVRFSPPWLRRLPSRSDHIRVLIR